MRRAAVRERGIFIAKKHARERVEKEMKALEEGFLSFVSLLRITVSIQVRHNSANTRQDPH